MTGYPGRIMVRAVLLAGVWLGCDGHGFAQSPVADPTYLQELIASARTRQLANTREWEVLLHYRPSWRGGVVSEVDGPSFFLAADGKRNPEAELEATLTAFFSPPVDDPLAQHPQCQFVARYHWLNSRLGFDPARLPHRECRRFQEWMAALDPESVTVIFPSAYLNNPSSMFGHTLLRIDRANRADTHRLLDYTINYAAATDTPTAFLSIVLGLTGGLPGRFSITPYYIKAREYNDIESRDIWEYRLAFNRQQIQAMLRHAWELGNTSFDYFFFNQNCSFQLLALLDAADPGLRLAERFGRFGWWTIPTDTIRALLDAPGLVTRVSFRPALSTELIHHRSLLRTDEHRWLYQVLEEPSVARSSSFAQVPEGRRAMILDVAAEYVSYKKHDDDPERAGHYQALQRQLLVERAALRVVSDTSPPPAPPPPEAGHRTARVGLAGGRAAGEWFGQLSLRPALHDLLGDETGYTSNSQIELANIELRYDRAHRMSLHRLDAVRIVSLAPYDRLIWKPSWQLGAGFTAVDDLSFRHRSAPTFELGVGGAVQSAWWRREVWYLLGELAGQYGAVFDEHYRAGLGATGGLLFDLTTTSRAHAFTTYRAFPVGDRSSDLVSQVEWRHTLSKDWDLRVAWKRRADRREVLLTLNAYF